METPMQFRVMNMAVQGDGVHVLLHGFVEEQPKTDAPFVGHPSGSAINLLLRKDVASKFQVGSVLTINFE